MKVPKLNSILYNCFLLQFDFFVQCENSQGFIPLAGVKLNSARISFDVFIDNQSEMDLICESTELVDTRFSGKYAEVDTQNIINISH